MEKALVTGGAGFIGSWVVDSLITNGLEVIVVDNLTTGNKKNLNKKTKFYEIDIRDKKISKIFKKENPDYVFHLAAQINLRESMKNPIEDANVNIFGSLNLLDNCVKNKVRKIIFSSTGGAIYGDGCKIPTSEAEKEEPSSPYGIAKLSIENYLKFYKKIYGLDYTCLRYSNVYGPRQNNKGEAGVVAIFMDKILSKEELMIIGSGNQTRDYVYVKDVANANMFATDFSGIYNVGTGKETSVNNLYEKIKKVMDANVSMIHTPGIKGEQMRSCLDASNLLKEGWKPKYNLDEGLKETIEYFKREN
ncbi:NAD-dependent epimerase/dehydratase family protein [Candidatus Pacearchaeota archaeon]|nr:NAD-dependent epimerase/dehydratase family protein [Candidatus Pacearchaeota archaeon]